MQTYFVELLQSFYKDAKCETFFNENETLYREAAARFLPVCEKVDLKWYDSFFGKNPGEDFIVIVALGNGADSYGAFYNDLNGKNKEVYAIMGTWDADRSGMPEFKTDAYFPVLLHEFNHSFVNPLVDKSNEAFKDSAENLFDVVREEMARQAYGDWRIMLKEALVRASVIKYYMDHGASKSEIDPLLSREIGNSFLWIRPFVGELIKYDAQREVYPTLESYVPQLAQAYKTYAAEVAKVESIKEFVNADQNVDPNLKTITLNFSRALSGKGYSFGYGSKGKEAFPAFDNSGGSYIDGNKSFVIPVQLEPDREYSFIVTGRSFVSPEGVALKSHEINFKTGK